MSYLNSIILYIVPSLSRGLSVVYSQGEQQLGKDHEHQTCACGVWLESFVI